MAQGDIVLYNDFKERLALGGHNLSTDTIKVILVSSYTPNIDTHQVLADVVANEYATSAGYTAGGKTLGSKTVTQDNTNDRMAWDAADITWAALGPLSPASPSHAIIYNDTPTSPADPLIGYIVLGSVVTDGSDLTLALNSIGILTLT